MDLLYLLIQAIAIASSLVSFPLTMLAPISQLARAMESRTATWALPTLAGVNQLRLEGYRPSVELTMSLPAGWEFIEGTIQLVYQVNGPVQAGAEISVRLNDHPIYTTPLSAETGSLPVALPSKLLQVGDNRIEITALLPLPSDPQCLRPNDPARWIIFHSESSVQVKLLPAKEPLRFDMFPAQFELGGGLAQGITFVLPDKPTNLELSALSQVAFAIAHGTTSNLPWTVMTASEWRKDSVVGPLVLIGAANRNRHLARLVPTNSERSGWLTLTRSSGSNDYPVLAVGGPDDQKVLEAAIALMTPAVIALPTNPTTLVPNIEHVLRTPPLPPDTFTLATLGYGEGIVRGTGTQMLRYEFDRPFSWSAQDSQLDLDFVHSRSLQSALSYLTVLVNGQIAARIQLDAVDGAPHRVSVLLPAKLLRPGRNVLQFAFNLISLRCGIDAPEGFWGKIRPDTSLTLPHGHHGGRLDLVDFPSQLTSPVDLPDLAIVLPLDSGTDEYGNALDLVRALSISKATIAPQLIQAETLDEQFRQLHLIVLGPPSRQPAITVLNSFLPVPFDVTSDNLQPNYGPNVLTNVHDLGVVQILRSPWTAQRLILVVAGTSWRGFKLASSALRQPQLRQHLMGKIALVTEQNTGPLRIYTYAVADLSAIPGIRTVDWMLRYAFGGTSRWPVIIMPLVALLVCALIIIFVLRWQHDHRNTQSGGH